MTMKCVLTGRRNKGKMSRGQLRIREIPGLNLCKKIGYPDCGFS
jgi:hypothetical protein